MNILCYEHIIQEIIYYANYDKVLGKDIILSYTSITKEEMENIISSISNETWKEVIIHYFYSHTSDIGLPISLEQSVKQNPYVNENITFYKNITKQFIDELLKHDDPLFFIDVDNTLTDKAYLSKEKIEFISNWHKKQNIILSTGKAPFSIDEVINECQLQDNYSSSLNGSIITKNNKFTMVSKIGEVSKKLIEALNNTNITYITYYENIIHIVKEIRKEDEELLKKYSEWHIDQKKEVDYNRIIKIMTFIYDDNTPKQKQQEALVRKIIEPYPNLVCVRTAYHCYEILDKNQHKGNTVKMISEKMNKYYRTSIGIGDSMNDLPMLNYVGYPYIVSNASDELKSFNFPTLEKNRNIDIVNILKKYDK